MAKKAPSFNFGAGQKPRTKKPKKAASGKKRTSSGGKSNAWRAYVSAPAHSSAPIPD